MKRAWAPLLILASLLAIWFVVTVFGWVSPLYLPSPMSVAESFRPRLLQGILVTCARMLAGVAIGTLAAYLFHFVAFRFGVASLLDRQLAGSRSVPVIALLPLFVMWFGFSELGRVLIVSISAMLFIIGPLQTAYSALPRQWSMLQEQLQMSSLRYYGLVVFPGTLPMMLGAYRLTFATSFTMAIASEYMGADEGIGKFIDSARVTFNVPAMFLAILIASVIGFVIDQSIVWVFKRFVRWNIADEKH